jgi:hypothetical protein
MAWVNGTELTCDKCKVIFLWSGSRSKVSSAARAKKWRLVDSPLHGGGALSLHLCASCVREEWKKPRKKGQESMEGEIPLF